MTKFGSKWRKSPFHKSSRQIKTIFTQKAGIATKCNNHKRVGVVFKLFLTDDGINMICKHTNHMLVLLQPNHPLIRNSFSEKKPDESICYIELLIRAQKIHCNHCFVEQLWNVSIALAKYFYTALLSRNRFKVLSSFNRFDDRKTIASKIGKTGD